MVQEEQQYHKLHQKQMQAEQESACMHNVPECHDAEQLCGVGFSCVVLMH